MKKFISILLTAVILTSVFTIVPFSVNAAEIDETVISTGDSTSSTSFFLTDSLGWSKAYLYAWDAGNNLIRSSYSLQRIVDNSGVGQFVVIVPEGAARIIINNGSGAITEDITDFTSYTGYMMDGSRDSLGHYKVTGWNNEETQTQPTTEDLESESIVVPSTTEAVDTDETTATEQPTTALQKEPESELVVPSTTEEADIEENKATVQPTTALPKESESEPTIVPMTTDITEIEENTTPTNNNQSQISFMLVNNFGWSTAYVYAWDDNDQPINGEWPGNVQAEKIYNEYGQTRFVCVVPDGAAGVVINNGKGEQTEDIMDFGSYEGYWMDGTKNSLGYYFVTGYGALKPEQLTTTSEESESNLAELSEIDYEFTYNVLNGQTIITGYNNKTIKTLNIPETLGGYPVTTIKSHAFDSYLFLVSVTLPNTVITIESYAFRNCRSLKNVKLSNSLSELGAGAFAYSSIEKIEIPKSLNNATFYNGEYYAINGEDYYIIDGPFFRCEGLKTVSFEQGALEVSNCLFTGCTGLEEIVIPDTVQRIKDYAFCDCLRLNRVTIGNSVTIIDNHAFENCISLKSISLSDSVTSIGNNLFDNCSKSLVIYSPKYSFPTIYFIDNNFDCVSSDDSRLTEPTALNVSESRFNILSGAKLKVTCDYSIKEEVFEQGDNYSVKIHIPEGSEIEEGSMYMNKQLLTQFNEGDGYIQIPVSVQNGKITFNLETEADCKLRTYAVLNYRLNGNNGYDIIDVINENISLISLETEDIASSNIINVSGVAPAGKSVSVFVDDVQAATFTANKAGVYSGKITVNNAVDDREYTIKAVASDKNGSNISAEKTVTYRENAPELTGFTMKYNGKTYDLMSGQKNSITFVHADRPFTFEVKYDHYENVNSVYITSTRNQVTKAVKVDWNEAKKAYVFNGYFDKNDYSYVPGTIGVNYTPSEPEFNFANAAETEYSAEKFLKGSDNPILAAYQGNLEDCLEDFYSEDNKFSGIVKLTDINTYFDFNIATDIIPSYLDPQNASKYCYEAIEDDLGVMLYMKVAENLDDKLEGEIADFATGKITKFLINGGYISESAVNTYFAFTKSMGYMDKLIKWDNTRTDINELKQRIMTAGMSAEERTEAMRKMDIASKANNGAVAVMALNIVISAAGIAIPFPASLILPMIALNNNHLVESALGDYDYLNNSYVKSGKAKFNWSIDPSGYIYSGDTSNRIQGAKVTAYWIPFDEEDEHYWDAPDESKAVIWDSSDYSQLNPLISDNDGNYAWDVPEGWWRVVVEKDGYETYTTDWLPVPPPQTEVNIDLVPVKKEIINGVYYENGVAKNVGLVQVDNDYYCTTTGGKLVYGDKEIFSSRTNGLLPPGTYHFDEVTGKLYKDNVIINNVYYKEGAPANVGIVKVAGSYYVTTTKGVITKNATNKYIASSRTNGLVAVGYYDFGADGKMILRNGIIGGKYYVNGKATNVGLFEYEVDGVTSIYCTTTGGAILKNVTDKYIAKSRTNGLVPAGYYSFDSEGKMFVPSDVLV